MRVNLVVRESAPERLVSEAGALFESESRPLAGMKLVRFSLWRSPEGEVCVRFPSRAFGTGNERRFFDYLRSVEDGSGDGKRRQGLDPRRVPRAHSPGDLVPLLWVLLDTQSVHRVSMLC